MSMGSIDGKERAELAEKAQALAHTVAGDVTFEHGQPADGIVVRAYDRRFGGDDRLLAEDKTASDGSYALSYEADGQVNLELRGVDASGREVALSEPKFGAARAERLRLVAPAALRPLAPEFARLAGDVAAIAGDEQALAGAREGDGRRDLGIVAATTGWDARLLALAAAATRLSAETKLPAEALYGLFRTGLPTDPQRLARVDAKLVDEALARAVKAGVIGRDAVKPARAAFVAFAREQVRAARAPGAVSSLGELLAGTDLNAEQRKQWEEIYLTTPPARLWKTAAKALPAEAVAGLQLDGKLSALTRNNAPLMRATRKIAKGDAGLGGLVDAGLYRAEAWEKAVREAADGDVDDAVPSAYAGDSSDARVRAYAEDMARKVRLAFPTRVVGDLLERGELKLDGDGAAVGRFLKQATEQGFELGRMPVEQAFARAQPARRARSARAGRAAALARPSEEIVDGVKTIQRVYQISPSDSAMAALLEAGLTSAQDVAEFTCRRFVEHHGAKFASREEALMVCRKSVQVNSVAYGLLTGARAMDSSTPVGVISGDGVAREAAKAGVIKQYPTMEQLFGSLDFCECQECRSVLSPAAYLVDLLQFIDRPPLVWDAFTTDWNAKHDKQFAAGFAADYDKPFAQLDRRRPDLQYLPLTCENTNTALPYIDIVNEILEYQVVHGSLAGDAGHDTGSATSQELLAEPQHVLAAAYDTLLTRRFPLALPFDLWIETVRAFLGYFEVPLHRLLETFRATDELFAPQNPTAPFYRAQVFAESLGLAPAEWALYTPKDAAAGWWELYGDDSDASARAALASAKTLARRLDVTYRELVELLQTGFVNPRLARLVGLAKMGIDVGEVYRYQGAAGAEPMSAGERAAFERQLAAFKTATGFDAKAWVQARYADGTFSEILVLADPDPGCDFERTRLQYADGDAPSAVDFVRLNLLVRLWRATGWRLDELDRALCALIPPAARPLSDATLGPALGSAILYLSHLSTLADELSLGPAARSTLPALWTDIATTGADSLYARLFLTPRALANDPIFDDPVGDYLSDAAVLLKDHRTAVQAALTLTAREVDAILEDARVDADTAPLSLATVSLLYRYGLLMRALKLPVADFVALKRLSGLDPLAPIDPEPLNADPARAGGVSALADDRPFAQTLAFVRLAREIADSGLSIPELQYLLVHDADGVARFRPDRPPALALLHGLRAEITRVRAEHRAPEDPATLDDETLRQKLALVLPGPAVDAFMSMWAGTIEYAAVATNVDPADALDPVALADLPFAVAYDPATQEQRLTFTGVLLDARRQQIEADHPSAVLSGLLTDVRDQARAYYDRWFSTFLGPADYPTLFKPIPTAPVAAQATIAARRAAVATGLYPYLQARLTRQLVVSSLAAVHAADPELVDALVRDATLLHDPTAGPGTPMLDAFVAAADSGLTAEWFASDDCTGAPLIAPAPTVATADTAARPNGANSARLSGCLEVPATGAYRFVVELDKQDAAAVLRFAHLPDAAASGIAADDGAEIGGRVDLKAGVPYPFTLELRDLGGGGARALVIGEALPREPLDRLVLSPQSAADRVRRATTVLAKVLRLAGAFGLVERELAHLLTHPADFALDLSALPADATPGGAPARLEQVRRLAGYAALKRDMGLDGAELIDVFERARRAVPTANAAARDALLDDLCERVAALARREPQTVRRVADLLGFSAASPAAGVVAAPDFAQERGLRRLWDALALLETLGVPAEAIGRWVKIVDPAAANRSAIAQDVKNTVKARFEGDAWYAIAQPTFDALRKLKRDALVAYVVDHEGFDSPDRIYEHLLLDPGMEPVVQTSRIQAAIASVQLFVQRCLLNLEARVPAPAIVGADGWEWMKRYRFWEANRRIFLYPENWLEPEFRDDKTPLFADLEGALLQGDVTNDAAEDAFLAYLQGLETIARLQIVSMHVEERDDAVPILHVFGRTHATPHAYHYRRLVAGAWTAWQPVDVEIDGDHVAAVKWRDRMHLFWVTFVDRAAPGDQTMTPRQLADTTVAAATTAQVEIRLNWTALVDGTWTPRASGPPFTTIVKTVSSSFSRADVAIFVTKETRDDGTEGAVRIHLGGEIQRAFRLATRNSPPTAISDRDDPPASPYSATDWNATMRRGDAPLSAFFPETVTTEGGRTEVSEARQQILGAVPEGRYDLLLADGPLRLPRPDLAPLAGPFFYADDVNTFFVAPEVQEETFDVWEKWVVDDPGISVDLDRRPDWWRDLVVVPYVPVKGGPQPPEPDDPWQRFEVTQEHDWVTDPATVLEFDGGFVGERGGVDIQVAVDTGAADHGNVVITGAGSAPGAGVAYVSTGHGQTPAFLEGSGLVIVGAAGLNGPAVAAMTNGRGLAGPAGI
jgi:hypothetical protein